MEVAGVPPGNDHEKLVALADDWLAKATCSGAQPPAGVATKLAVGKVTMVNWPLEIVEPQAFVAVSVTLYTPSVA